MNDLDKLRAEVAVGWKVRITDHDHSSESRDDVTVTEVRADGMTLTPRRPWSSQGRKFSTMWFPWENKDEVSGRTVRLYTVGTGITSRSQPGVRRLVKTYVFEPPRG